MRLPVAKKSSKKEKPSTNYTPDKTKELLLDAARMLFAQKGFDGATVKELADLAQVNVGLVSYHFGGKEGLYRACIENFGKTRLEVAKRLLIKPQSAEEFKVRLQMFLTEILESFVEQPEATRIVQRECDVDESIVQDIFARTFLKVYETLVEFVRSGQKLGLVGQELDVHSAVGFLFGGLTSLARNDKVGEKFFGRTIKDPKYRKKVADEVYRLFLTGLSP